MMEYLNNVFIGKLTANFQTIDSTVYSLKFFVEFYVSESPFNLNLELFSKELQLMSLPDDFNLFDAEYISNLYDSVAEQLSEGNNHNAWVILPYTHIVVGEKYGDDLKEEKLIDDDNDKQG